MFEYRLLPKPSASKKAKGLKTVPERFAHALTEMLNIEAKSGWEFVGQETFSVDEKSSVMKKTKHTDLTYLVFRRTIAADAVPLDEKLENMKNMRARTMIREAAAPSIAAAAAVAAASTPEPAEPTYTYTPPEEPTVVVQPEPTAEPFPEPMPAYVPEEPKLDSSRSLPFPGPAPSQTIGTGSGATSNSGDDGGPTMNYDHSRNNTGASVDAPILGPAKRD